VQEFLAVTRQVIFIPMSEVSFSLDDPIDAIVIGGGPAGASAARLLASWGHSVLLLTKGIDPARGLAESLPPSTRKLLATIGVLDEIERAGFYRTTGNTVWWASRERRVETFEPSGDASGFQVFRPDLDRLMRDSAARAGVQLIDDAAVRQVHLPQVEFERANGARATAAARFVLDCSGHTGVIARQGFRRYEPGGRMQAFIGVWQRQAGWDLPDETQTLVETYEDGWSWSVPVGRTTRHVGAMLDASTTRITRGRIEEAYRAELAKTRELHALMTTSGAELRHVWACDASLYAAEAYAGPGFLLVGDAGSFIDPLSSFGVKKALASAWLAAIAVHTCLAHPDREAVALDFFTRWERQVYASNLERTRDFARAAHAQHPSAFWATRADSLVSDDAATATEAAATDAGAAASEAVDAPVDEAALLQSPEVQAAFDRVKRSPAIDLAWAAHLRFEPRAVIRDREIVLEDAVPLRAARTSLRYLAGVDLVKLGDMACHHRQVSDLYEAYCRTHTPVSLPGFLGSLSVLLAHGILTARDP
jgi:flavin-dependent dehydrogenase